MERLSARERARIAELLAEDAPFWRLLQEVPRSRYAIYRAVKRLKRPPATVPTRSPLRPGRLNSPFTGTSLGIKRALAPAFRCATTLPPRPAGCRRARRNG